MTVRNGRQIVVGTARGVDRQAHERYVEQTCGQSGRSRSLRFCEPVPPQMPNDASPDFCGGAFAYSRLSVEGSDGRTFARSPRSACAM